MANVTSDDLSDGLWATSDGVRDYLDIPTQGTQKDVETFIDTATDSVQAWWKRETDGNIPDDLPDPSTIEEDHPLLVKATELQAASEAHEAEAQNFRSESDEGQARHVFLEERARQKFDEWVTVNGYDTTDTTQAQGSDFPASGLSSNLTEYGGDYG